MALPSQMERSADYGKPVMGRTSRTKITPAAKYAIAAGAVVLGGFAIWGLASAFSSGPEKAGANGIAPITDSSITANTPKPVEPTIGTPPPISLSQGASQGSSTQITGINAPSGLGRAVDPTSPSGTRPLPVDVTAQTGTGNLTAGTAPNTRPNLAPATTPTNAPSNTPTNTPTNTSNPATTSVTQPNTQPIGQSILPLTPTASTVVVQQLIAEGDRLVASGKLVEARVTYSKAMLHPDAASSDKSSLRTKLTTINDDLVFSTKVTPGDPLVESYKVVSGDSLTKIRKKRDLATDMGLIARINKMADRNALKVGQTLKLVRGPFHAVVSKSDFRLDLFTGSPDEPDRWVYIKSYRVGLGEGNSTPVGSFVIKKNSKLENPHWVNPRTGEKFNKEDPKNPIGERWLGWQGVGASAINTGYGIHGTIEPDSIGQQRSMGCVRLGNEDVAQIYDMLVEEVSVVKVQP